MSRVKSLSARGRSLKAAVVALALSLSINAAAFAQTPAAQTAVELREEFHQTYPLSADGRLSLKSITGSVRIMTWDRNEVKLDALKRSSTKQGLSDAEIRVDASADSIRIKTRYPDDCCFYAEYYQEECCSKLLYRSPYRRLAAVDYTLTVPRRARLEAIELMKGSIAIEGIAAPVIASTMVGSIEAKVVQLDQETPISLTSLSGSIALTIPSNSNALILSGTTTGKIANDFGLTSRKGELLGEELAGRLGSGGARITLDTVNGSIIIRRAADNRPPSAATNLMPQPTLDLDSDTKRASSVTQRIAIKARRDAERVVREAIEEGNVTVINARELSRAINEAISSGLRITIPPIQIPELNINPNIAITPNVKVVPKIKPAPKVVTPRPGRDVRARVPRPARTRELVPVASPFRLTETESRSFKVSALSTVKVENLNGPIVVRAWDKPEVMINAVKKGQDEQSMRGMRLRSEQRGAEVLMVAEFDDSSGEGDSDNVMLQMEIFVPSKANLSVSSTNGSLKVEGVTGEIDLHTYEGLIEVMNAGGRLRANTSDGRIQVLKFDGEVDARTDDGQINLEGRFTELSARTGDGSISLAVPAGFNAIVETAGTSVVFDGLDITEEAESSGRLRRWKIGSGGKLLSLRTGEGRIVLRRASY